MSYLLAHGANVNTVDKHGYSVLKRAHLYSCSKCVELLIEHGADKSSLQGLKFGSKREVCRIYDDQSINYNNSTNNSLCY